MTDCIFCQIASGQKQEAIVYEDDTILAFMDRFRQPSTGGHVLIIPKAHFETLCDLPGELCAPLMHASHRITRTVKKAFPCTGVRLWIANGKSAGQEIAHLHMHVFPCRSTWDRVKYLFPSLTGKRHYSDQKLNEMAVAIQQALQIQE